MKINPELLKRYASGECTEEERLLVENWTPDDADVSEEFTSEKVDKIKLSIWEKLSGDLPAELRKGVQRPIFKYGAAACLLVGMAGALLFSGNTSNSLHAEESNREIHRRVKSSGTVSIRVASPDESPAKNPDTILTECFSEDCTPQVVELDSTETYYAIRFQQGSDQAAIFSSEDLSRFTPALWRRIVTISQLP